MVVVTGVLSAFYLYRGSKLLSQYSSNLGVHSSANLKELFKSRLDCAYLKIEIWRSRKKANENKKGKEENRNVNREVRR